MRFVEANSKKKKDVPDYMKRRCFVRWGGDVVQVLVDPDEPSVTMKEMLEEHTGIPVDDQRIFYNGMKKAFAHDKSLRYYGAQSGGFFDLARDEDLDEDMNIIRRPRRRTSLPSGSGHGSPMDDSSSNAADKEMDMSLQEAKLHKQRARRASLMEKAENLKKIQEEEEAREAEEKQKQAEEAARKAAEAEKKKRQRNIKVTTPEGQVIAVVLDQDDTVGDIKKNIEGDCKIPRAKQVLKYNGKVLDNDSGTLEQLKIPDGAELTVEPFRIPISVNTPDGKQIQTMVDPELPLADLKKQLEAESGVAAKDQKLFLQGKELDSPNKTLEEYGVKSGSVLDMVDEAKQKAEEEARKQAEEEEKKNRIRKIFVSTPDGQTLTLTLDQDDKVAKIKDSIADDCKIPPSKQVLKYNGQVLGQDYKTLEQLKIPDGAKLTVEPFKVPITVNTPDGKQIYAMVDPSMPLADLNKQLESESGVAAKDQKLFLQGTELKDPTKKLEDYGIKAGSVLDLVDEAKRKAEENAKKAEEDAKRQAEEDAKKAAEEEAKRLADEEAKKKAAEEEAKRKADDEARLKAEAEAKAKAEEEAKAKAEKKTKKKKKKKKDDDDDSVEFPVHESKDYSIDFQPTPFDLTRFKVWFMIGDQVPFEMVCPIAMDIKGFKVEILKLRNDARFVKQYFEGLEDPNELKIYPAGSWGEGDPLPDDLPVPKDSSEYKFFSVLR